MVTCHVGNNCIRRFSARNCGCRASHTARRSSESLLSGKVLAMQRRGYPAIVQFLYVPASLSFNLFVVVAALPVLVRECCSRS